MKLLELLPILEAFLTSVDPKNPKRIAIKGAVIFRGKENAIVKLRGSADGKSFTPIFDTGEKTLRRGKNLYVRRSTVAAIMRELKAQGAKSISLISDKPGTHIFFRLLGEAANVEEVQANLRKIGAKYIRSERAWIVPTASKNKLVAVLETTPGMERIIADHKAVDATSEKLRKHVRRAQREAVTAASKAITAGSTAKKISQTVTRRHRRAATRSKKEIVQLFKLARLNAVKELGATVGQPVSIFGSFTTRNPDLLAYLRRFELWSLENADAGAVGRKIRRGIREGVNPRVTAQRILHDINVTPGQSKWIENLNREAIHGDRAMFKRRIIQTMSKDAAPSVIKTLEKIALTGQPPPLASARAVTTEYARGVQKYRAESIARTETLRAIAESRQAAHVEAEKVLRKRKIAKMYKKWLFTFDTRTRPAHRRIPTMNPARGIPISKAFKSPLGKIRFPLDPAAKRANTIQCRCSIKYVAVRL